MARMTVDDYMAQCDGVDRGMEPTLDHFDTGDIYAGVNVGHRIVAPMTPEDWDICYYKLGRIARIAWVNDISSREYIPGQDDAMHMLDLTIMSLQARFERARRGEV